MKCEMCGQEKPVEPMVKPGDWVEVTYGHGWDGVGIVRHVLTHRANASVSILLGTGTRKGSVGTFFSGQYRVIHGYIHINRALVTPDHTRYVL